MSDSPLIYTIDQGTQSTRALLFDLTGNLVAKSQILIEPYKPNRPNQAEQNPDYFWQQICHASTQLWEKYPKLKQRVIGASIAVQRASVVCLDKDKKPLRPAIIWLDQRRADNPPTLPLWLRLGAKAANQINVLNQLQSKAECNWIAEKEPKTWEKTTYYVLLSGYLIYKMTGRLCDSVASQVGYLPFDYKKQTWAHDKHWLWQALRVKREQLPELVSPGEKIANISNLASKELGLPEGIPVIAAGADKACEVLGSGALTANIANISYGTTATLNTCHRRFVTPQPLLPPYPAAIAGAFNTEVSVQRGYWMVNWFKQQFAHEEVQRAQQLDLAPEVLFEEFLEQTNAGAMGLILQPFWNPGPRYPGPEAKGAIIGFGEAHTKAHLYRAIVEGVAYALLAGTITLERRQKAKIEELRITGGGAQSDRIMQITADIFNKPAWRIHTVEATGLGAAMNVAVGLGYFPDYTAASAAMTHKAQEFLPRKKEHQQYQQLFEQVYQQLYAQLKPLYKAIKQITGYPKH